MTTGRGFKIAPDLGPSEAPDAHAALLDWLGRRSAAARLDLAPGDGAPSPLALQMLAAVARSEAHPDVRFGPAAAAALATFDTAEAMETPPR